MAEPTTSNYPASLDTSTSLGADQVDLKSFTLGGTIGAGDTSIPASATITGITAPFYLLADSELIYVEGISGSNFTPCVRGRGGTTAVSHTSGITLYVVYAANLFNQLKRAIIAIETEIGAAPSSEYASLIAMFDVGAPFSRGHIWGLTLSNNGTDATNDIDISAGEARDVDNTEDMILASALTKRLDAAWAVGTNQGGLDTGSIADTTYHVWLIKRTDTGVVDVLFSTSVSSPTMPTNYTKKRLIGSIRRISASIKGFVQDNDLFMWKSPVEDVNVLNPGTAAVTRTLTLPLGRRLEALISVSTYAPAAGDVSAAVYISDLSLTDVGPGVGATGGWQFYNYGTGMTAIQNGAVVQVFTNTSAQVRSRIQLSVANTQLFMNTLGWIDTRGRLS